LSCAESETSARRRCACAAGSAYNLIGLWVRREGNNDDRKEERDEEKWKERKRIPEIAVVIVRGPSGPCRGGRRTDVLRRSE